METGKVTSAAAWAFKLVRITESSSSMMIVLKHAQCVMYAQILCAALEVCSTNLRCDIAPPRALREFA